jgi:hypothetical protein
MSTHTVFHSTEWANFVKWDSVPKESKDRIYAYVRNCLKELGSYIENENSCSICEFGVTVPKEYLDKNIQLSDKPTYISYESVIHEVLKEMNLKRPYIVYLSQMTWNIAFVQNM